LPCTTTIYLQKFKNLQDFFGSKTLNTLQTIQPPSIDKV